MVGERPADLRWDAVVDSSHDSSGPAEAGELVDAGRRIVYIGLAGAIRLYAAGAVGVPLRALYAASPLSGSTTGTLLTVDGRMGSIRVPV